MTNLRKLSSAFPKFIALALLAISTAGAGLARAEMMGSPGYPGSDGYRGSSGSDGRDATVFADGAGRAFYLSGTDGQNGGMGMPGGDAGCPYYQGTPPYNLYGADGGRGGDAGSGGNGGDGGNITVYFENLANLRTLAVFSVPGRGGAPGGNAYGGRGCRCELRSWKHQYCHENDQHQQVCEDRWYSCSDGRDGYPGSIGSWGSNGSYGHVTLIPQREPLAPVTPALSIGIASLSASGTAYGLSDNRWLRRSGANELFAPGTQVQDTYTIFSHRVDRTGRIEWAAGRPVSDFPTEGLTLELAGDDSVNLGVDDDSIWADITRTAQVDGAKFVINRVVRESEARNLKYLGISGKGDGLVAKFQDLGGLSSLVQTAVHVRYETEFMLFYWKRYEGDLTNELVSVNQDIITVALGRLPLKAKFLTPKKHIRLTFEVSRSYHGHATTFEVKKAKERIEP